MKRKMFAGADKLIFRRADELRKQQTFAEEILWNYLRTKPFGYKFRRQHPFSIYILDFYCHSLHLVIEVDGSIHNLHDVKEHDEQRQNHLEEYGLKFLRFTNVEVISKSQEVIRTIENLIQKERLNE